MEIRELKYFVQVAKDGNYSTAAQKLYISQPALSKVIHKGANAYLKRQYKGVGIFFAAVFVILMGMAICGFLSFFTPFKSAKT